MSDPDALDHSAISIMRVRMITYEELEWNMAMERRFPSLHPSWTGPHNPSQACAADAIMFDLSAVMSRAR